MNKIMLSTALSIGLCLPVYAAQYSNHGDAVYEGPSDEAPNTSVKQSKEEGVEKAMPITLLGEHAVYDQVSGDFHAEGNVKVSQGGQDIYTTRVKGNMKTGDIWLLEGGTLVEEGAETNAEWAYYNFNSKTGELKKLSGKNGKDYFKAPHGTVYPDRMILDEGGSTTRCPAVKNPSCMEIKAKTFEIYPGEKMIARDVQVWVRGKHIYSRDVWENDLTDNNKERLMPHVGFKDSDKGAYINLSYERPLSDKTTAYADLNYYTKDGYKPLYGLRHNERNFVLTFENGWFEDDDAWVKKQTDLRFDYKPHHFSDKLPLSYSFYAEHGLWKNEDTGERSWHTEYGAFLNHDRIYLFNSPNTTLDMTIGKKWTHESKTGDTESTNVYYATLGQKLSDKWNTWVGWYKEDFTTRLFTYDQPDMQTELRNGLSYKMDDKNIFTIVNRYDLDRNTNYETDYRWTHRFCCWQVSLEYQQEHYKNDNSFEIKYEFVNW